MAEQSREPEILKSIIDDTEYNKTPQSRNEEILLSILNDTEYTKTPQSREEELLLELKGKIGPGVTVEPLSVTENGTYTAPEGTAYSPVEVTITPPQIVKRVTGNPVEFSDGADAPVVKCVTQITGSQDLHGYDKPWVGGAGKNKLDPLYRTEGSTNVYFYQSDGFLIEAGKTYTLSCDTVIDTISVRLLDSTTKYSISNSNTLTFTPSEDMTVYFRFRNDSGVSTIGDFQLELGSTATSYSPYSNICPITAYTEGEIEVSDGDEYTTTHTTTYPSAIYRGSEDVVNGEVTSEWVLDDMGDYTWTKDAQNRFVYIGLTNKIRKTTLTEPLAHAICSAYQIITPVQSATQNDGIAVDTAGNVFVYDSTRVNMSAAEFKTAIAGQGFAYELATPTTSPVTPTNLPIRTLSGYNHIESSTGEMVLDYITDKYQNFVDTVNRSVPNTRKSGSAAMDVFMSLEQYEE